jgi:Ca2+-binding RTX toxin-like protein
LITADGDANTVLLGADSITADAALDLTVDEHTAYGALLTSAYIITDFSDTIVNDDGTGLDAAIAGSVNVKLLDQPTLAQLKTINTATSGNITLEVTNGPLSGVAADLTAAFAGTITAYTGNFTVSDSGSIAATVLSGLDAKTSGLLTAANITTLTGAGTEVRAVIDNLGSSGNKISLGAMVGNLSNVAVTLSGNAALSDLLAIDLSTSGAITASGVTTLSGSMTNIRLVTDNFGAGSDKFSIGTMTESSTNANLIVTDASVTAANLFSLDTVTTGAVSVSAGSTITGNDTEWSSLVGAEGVALPGDFHATVTGVVSTTISATLPALLSFIGENTTGEVKVEGTGANNTLNFSSTTYGLTIDGGSGVDAITGTAMDDVIIGGVGNDNITLGAGEDTLVFNSLSGIDTIADFNPTDDLVQLAKSVMTALGAVGALTDAEFESGAGLTAAVDSTTRIFYNETNGALFYDADGSGGVSAAVQLATFTGTPAPVLTFNDFVVI